MSSLKSVGRVTAIVVTYQSAEVLPDCLDALAVEAASVRDFELVVVDNDSRDGTEALASERWPGVLLVQTGRNAGYAAAINAGLEKRRGDGPVLILNPDVRLQPGSLVSMLAALQAPGTGIVVPRMRDGRGNLLPTLRREPTVLRALGSALLGARADHFPRLSEVVAPGEQYSRPMTADWATGAALLVTPACLRAVGSWDESFFLYSEETDFCLRARDAGHALVLEPAAEAVHLGGECLIDPTLWSVLTVNRVRLARRRLGRMGGATYTAAIVLNETLRALAGRRTARAALRGLVAPRTLPAPLREARDRATITHRSTKQSPVVCFSAQDFWYHNRAHSDVQLMRRLAASRQVLLVNSIGMRMPLPSRTTQPWRRIARKAASTSKLLRRPFPDLPDFAVLSPLVLPFYGSAAARALNARSVGAQVRWACRHLGIQEPTAIVTIPTAVDVLSHLAVRGVVFNRSDKHSEFGETDQTLIRSMEDRLLRTSDAVLYVSHQLLADESDRTGGRALFLDHGVDLAHFIAVPPAPDREPPELRGLPSPRVGFFGGLDDYVVDLELLERVARDVPQAQLVLVGDATCSLERLTALPNVTWVPRRPYEQIPSFGRALDVALMPWLQNDWIRSCNPIKLKEYLALGLPVVSTDFPEVRRYADVVRVAGSHEEFVHLVRRSLDDRGPASPAARREAVAQASWDAVAARLGEVCEAVRRSVPLPPGVDGTY